MRGSPKVTMRRNEPCVRKREAGRSRRRERRRKPCTELAYRPYRKPCSAKLNPSREQRNEFKERHGPDFEKWWREHIAHTLDCLAQSEARYLARSPGVDTIRSRLAEAQQGGNSPGGPRSPREQKRHIADLRSRLRDRFSDGPPRRRCAPVAVAGTTAGIRSAAGYGFHGYASLGIRSPFGRSRHQGRVIPVRHWNPKACRDVRTCGGPLPKFRCLNV